MAARKKNFFVLKKLLVHVIIEFSFLPHNPYLVGTENVNTSKEKLERTYLLCCGCTWVTNTEYEGITWKIVAISPKWSIPFFNLGLIERLGISKPYMIEDILPFQAH